MDSRILPADLANSKLNDYNYEQGFDEQLLINSEFADCFSCPICHGIPRSPVIISLCGHFFCEGFIQKQLEAAKFEEDDEVDLSKCAVCKGHFQRSYVLPFEKFNTAMKKAYQLFASDVLLGVRLLVIHMKWISINHFNVISVRSAAQALDAK